MRLLFINNEYPPIGGGTATANESLVKQFQSLSDIEIDIVTSGGLDLPVEEQVCANIFIHRVTKSRKDIHHASNFELIDFIQKAFLKSLSLHKQKKYDLVFAWSTIPAGVVAYLLKKFSGLPYIVRISGPDIPYYEKRYNYIYPFLKMPVYAVWRNASNIVVKCQHEKDLILRQYSGLIIKKIPNAVDFSSYSNTDKRSREGRFKLLCVARLVERKGQSYIMKALSVLIKRGIDVDLTLVGSGDLENFYKNLAEKLGIRDRVYFEGYIPRDKVATYYHMANAFVLASDNEGMSNACLEAASAGLPLLVSENSSSEVVADGYNGYVFNTDDVNNLADKVEFLVKNRNESIRLGENALTYVQRFSMSQSAESYLNVFKQIIANAA